jgi:acyl-CoA synthetase (AMP-forming)/AMP-acid ligase II
MIYDLRTYTLKINKVPEAERLFAAALPARETISRLGAFFHTEIGTLNQIVHIWPYESLAHMEEAREAAAKLGREKWPPPGLTELLVKMESELVQPAPFMRPWTGPQQLGKVYELRTYDLLPGTRGRVLEEWGKLVQEREQFSPLAGCWVSSGNGGVCVEVAAARGTVGLLDSKDRHGPVLAFDAADWAGVRVTTLKPGSATFPLPGIAADVVDENGNSTPIPGGGYLVLTRPWPAMLRGFWGDPERYRATYWDRFDGVYFAGDGAKRDEEGYFWLLGRVDDVMNVSGHRISTTEVESALVAHDAVAEAAVTGASDPRTGQAICAFVTLRGSVKPDEALAELSGACQPIEDPLRACTINDEKGNADRADQENGRPIILLLFFLSLLVALLALVGMDDQRGAILMLAAAVVYAAIRVAQ